MVFPFLNRFKNGLVPDTTRKALPVGFTTPMSDTERFARFIRSHELEQAARAAGAETFQEADDFEVDDDPCPMPDAQWAGDFDRAFAGAVNAGIAAPPNPAKVNASVKAIKASKKLKSEPPAPTPHEGKGESVDEPLGQ
nr:MAG: hypothetical protein [Microvirus sp.]